MPQAIGRVGVELYPITDKLRSGLNDFAKQQASAGGMAKAYKTETDAIVKTHKSAQEAIAAASKKSSDLQVQYAKRTTAELVTEVNKEVKAKNDAMSALRQTKDKALRADITAEKHASEERLKVLRAELTKRPDVQKRGAGVGAGILGTGRQIISQSGIPGGALLAGGGLVAGVGVATVALKKLIDTGIENEKILNNLRAGFTAAGKSGEDLARSVDYASRSAQTLGDKYLIDNNIIEQFTGVYLKFGGSADQIAKKQEVIIGLAERTGMSFDDAAKALAKATDPEVALELKRQGIVIGDAATESERLAIVSKAVAGNLQGLADKANSSEGNVKRLALQMDNLMDTLGAFAVAALTALSPLLKITGQLIENTTSMIEGITKYGNVAGGAMVNAQKGVDKIIAKFAAINEEATKLAEDPEYESKLRKKYAEVFEITKQFTQKEEASFQSTLREGRKRALVERANANTVEAKDAQKKRQEEEKKKQEEYAKGAGTRASAARSQREKEYSEKKTELEELLRFQQAWEDVYAEQGIKSKEKAEIAKLELEQSYLQDELDLANEYGDKRDAEELSRMQMLIDARLAILKNAKEEVDTVLPEIATVGIPNDDGETNFGQVGIPDAVFDDTESKIAKVGESITNQLLNPLIHGFAEALGIADNFFGFIFEKLAELAANQIVQGIFQGLLSLIPGGGIASGLFSIIGGLFADGGDAPLNKVSIVGERGAEMIVPSSNGTRVIPLNPKGNYGGQSSGVAANPYSHVGGQNPQSIKIGGFINKDDRFKPSIKIGGFINRGEQGQMSHVDSSGQLQSTAIMNSINSSNEQLLNGFNAAINRINSIRPVVMVDQNKNQLSLDQDQYRQFKGAF